MTAKYFCATNPADGSVLTPAYRESSIEDAHQAAAVAANAFASFRRTTGGERAKFLDEIGHQLESLGETLVAQAHAESALSMARLGAERARTLNQIRYFADMAREGSWVAPRIDHADAQRLPPKPDVRSMLQPVGPVAVFGASNFPLAISVAGTDTISALAAGCPVIVKAHPCHPGTSALVASCIAKAVSLCGLPAGVFAMLQGADHELGSELVRHPAICASAFTGSLRAGRALFDAANARPSPIPVFAEMGSVNPVFVLPAALAHRPSRLADTFVESLNMGVGQYCTNPGLLFACEGPGLEEFLAALAVQVQAVAPASMLSMDILNAFEIGIRTFNETPGLKPLAHSDSPPIKQRTQAGCSVFLADAETFSAHPALAQEVFGPASLVVICKDKTAMMNVARNLQGQLSASVHSHGQDLQTFDDLLAVLEQKVGRLVFDGFATGIEVCAAMHHGGPYPCTTSSQHTSIGHASIYRFVRPVAYQNTPSSALPLALRDGNPLGICALSTGNWFADTLQCYHDRREGIS